MSAATPPGQLRPPANLATRKPLLRTLPIGSAVHRFYSRALDPVHFDRSCGPGTSRFNAPVRAMGTAAFRERNSNEALSAAFEPLRRLGFDLAPVLVTVPEITEPPTWQANGMLRVVGVFPTQPIEVPFAVVLAEEGGRWKINDLNVGARQHQQVVQGAPATATAKTAAAKPVAGGAVPGVVTGKSAGEKKPAAKP